MNIAELSWKTVDGITIYGKKWTTAGTPKAVICMVHGMGEHINRYDHVAGMLNNNGYAVIGCDLRGHGQSGGQRGHIPGFNIFMDDVDIFLQIASEHFPGTKKIVYAHSMGGTLVANYVIKRQPKLAGAILSSPYLELAFKPSPVKLLLGKWLKGIYPTLSMGTGLDSSALSKDKEVVRNYDNDPLVHDRISASMGIELIEAGKWALDNAEKLSVPTLIFHGTGDKLTSFEASKLLSKKADKLVTFVSFEGLYHETHNEPEKEEVFKVIINWCNEIIL